MLQRVLRQDDETERCRRRLRLPERPQGRAVGTSDGQYRLPPLQLLLPHPIPRNHITVRLMKRAMSTSLLLHREQQTVIGGLWVITGFKQIGIPVNKLARGKRPTASGAAGSR